MTEERLEALMLAVIERDLLLQLSTDDIVAQFAAAADRPQDEPRLNMKVKS